MVSTIRFPSFKNPPRTSRGRLWRTVAIVGTLSMLLIFQARFILFFLIVYTLATLLLNIAWRLGWRGIAPPVQHPEPVPELPVDTVH
jgi:CDP-diacylglycerol--serine O-phosphatidyltransferase